MTDNNAADRLETDGIGALLIAYSLPAIASMVIVSLYNIFSSVFIGHGVGALAIAGLAVTFPFMNLLLAVCMLVAIGGATVCSIALGAKDRERAARVLGHNVVLSLLFAVAFAVAGLVFLDPILRLFGASDATLSHARDYMEIILYGTPIGNLMVALSHFLRASGHPAKSMWISLASVGVNLALTPAFIFLLGWGTRGAAVATVLSQVFALALLLVHFSDKRHAVHFKRGIFRLRASVARSMLSIGLSPFLMNVCACLIVVVINLSLRDHGGDLAIGAYGIVNRLLMLFAMTIMGLTQGMQPLIGYNFGARRMDRVRLTLKYGIIAGTAVTSAGFAAAQAFPTTLAMLFTDHPDLIAMSVNGMRLCTAVFFIVGSQIVIAGYFQSMGRASIAIFMSLSRQLLLLLPGLIFLPRYFGLDGVWISMPLADTLSAGIGIGILVYTIKHPPVRYA
ncbi:MAG: MATE family efflux transporter [Desulfovibrio sp.]|jgi:putative MATE family efflux protein|nr:MATE family efflux transporter [Desulfovibrio sp.]